MGARRVTLLVELTVSWVQIAFCHGIVPFRQYSCQNQKERGSRDSRAAENFRLRYCVVEGCTPAVSVGCVGFATKKLWSYKLRYIRPAISAALGPNVGRPPWRNTTVTMRPTSVFA